MKAETHFLSDIEAIASIAAVPAILSVVCKVTGMGYAAIARVTEDRWICLASHDEIGFGLGPGGELNVETTICREVRQARSEIVIDHVAEDETYCRHHTPAMYGFQSYISMPIYLKDASFYGTLWAIDPKPRKLKEATVIGMFRMFADLIAAQLDAATRVVRAEENLLTANQTVALREQFIAVLGHDLRNPVAAFAAGMRSLRRAPLDEKTRSVVDLMSSSVDRMSALIEDIMDLARGRMGGGIAIERSTNDLTSALRLVVEELRATHPDRKIEAEFDLTETVSLDTGRIARALSNLLGNALAYGASDAPVVIQASTKDGFEMSVENSGADIPLASMQRLFAPFTRGDESSDKKGIGLGLYIVSQIARAHGGSIEATSGGGKTRFFFHVPPQPRDEQV